MAKITFRNGASFEVPDSSDPEAGRGSRFFESHPCQVGEIAAYRMTKRAMDAMLFPYLPKGLQKSIETSELIREEIGKTEEKLGKEKTKELVVQFKNEAYAQAGLNSDYVLNKLRTARIAFDK